MATPSESADEFGPNLATTGASFVIRFGGHSHEGGVSSAARSAVVFVERHFSGSIPGGDRKGKLPLDVESLKQWGGRYFCPARRTMKLTRMRSVLVAASMLVAGLQVCWAQTLGIGDNAPPLKVAKWVKGKPVEKFEAGKVYVVEFWATWCGPCRTTIPHLTEMAKKYAGKVSFTGVSVWEDMEGKDHFKTVEKFVAEMGAKMDYNVAVDGTDMTMAKTWMEAAGENGIPAAFIVKDGKIAWIGHPMDGMDKAIDSILDGKFDSSAAKKAREKEKEAEAAAAKEQAEVMAKLKKVMDAAEAGDMKKAVEEIDKVFVAEPALEKRFAMVKVTLLMQSDETAVAPYMKKLAAGIFKEDAMMLNQMAWMLVDEEAPMKSADPKVAIQIAEQAVKLTQEKDAMILDTLALAYFKDKQVKKAIETQEKAVKLLKDSDVDEETKKEIMDRLERFKKADG